MNNDYWFVGSHFQDFIINNKYFFSSCLNKLLFFNKLKSWLMNLGSIVSKLKKIKLKCFCLK